MKRCMILMATYNGGKYIRKQLQSICDQNYENWNLLIRDDGSTDDTLQIINEYIKNDSRISVLKNETDIHGAYFNFWSLINYARTLERFDYYFFADQDDIWEVDKLRAFVQASAKFDKTPLYVYSDMSTINSEGNIILQSVNETMGITMRDDERTLFYSQGYVWGCASMVNRLLFEKVHPMNIHSKGADIISHDNFYAKHALIIGNVLFINQQLIRHRRHENNTTGEYAMKLTPSIIIKKGLLSLDETAKTHALGYDQTLYTIDWMLNHGIVNEQLKKIKDSILSGGFRGALGLIRYKVRRPQVSRTIGIYIIMLTKKYKSYLTYKGV